MGVLEEKSNDILTSQQDSDSDSEAGEQDDTDVSAKKEPDIISKLMGQAKNNKQKPVQIQEIGKG